MASWYFDLVGRNIGVRRLNAGQGFADFDRHHGGGQRQLQIDGGYLADADLHIFLTLREIRRLGGEQVISGREQGEAVGALSVGDGFPARAGAIVLQRNVGSGNDGAGRVGDGAGDVTGDEGLRVTVSTAATERSDCR